MYGYDERWSKAVNEELKSIEDYAKEKKTLKKEKISFWLRLRKYIVRLIKKAAK